MGRPGYAAQVGAQPQRNVRNRHEVHKISLALLMMDTPSMEGVTMGTMGATTATTMEAMDIAMITTRATTTATREDTLTTLEDTVDMTATVIAAL